MQRMFAIALNRNTEFSVIGVANVMKGTVKFQGLLNGIPFTEHTDYERVHSRVMKAVEINQPQDKEELS
ncbi:MAG: hypothetical protein HC840_00430 [Leptolyngbyaceae cyanobacterium RM2_2_4]|nr:hypothetical protein [Leptolyngbyaceae cyanobacterium RM2_2_4]